MTKQDALILGAVMALWGLNFSVIKLGVNNINPLILTALRFTFAIFPLVFFVKKPDVKWRYLITYGLTFGVGVWGLATLSIDFGLSAGMASLLLNMSIVSSLFAGWLILGERITYLKLAGSCVALFGLMIIIISHGGTTTWQGLIVILVAACFWSVNGIIIKKAGTNTVFAFNIWAMLFAPVPLLLIAWSVYGYDEIMLSITDFNKYAVISILFQAYPTTLLGYWFWNKFIIKYTLSGVAPFTLMVPVFGLLGGNLFYDEAVTISQVIAATLILMGLFLSQSDSDFFFRLKFKVTAKRY